MLKDKFSLLTEWPKEPLLRLPENCSKLKIALRLTGGVGDVLMAIGGSANEIKSRFPDCTIDAYVMGHQIELLSAIPSLNGVYLGTKLNNVPIRSSYDVVLDFAGCFANSREIRDCDYYQLVSNRLGLPVKPAQFTFKWFPEKIDGRKVVAIHPGASNPNRRWDTYKWQVLTTQLIGRGLSILFLGTWDEFALEGDYITNASDVSDSLLDQAHLLSQCHYFIGNDSGFAHIAGMLGIPGTVLFSSTKPEHVISKYPSLRAAHCFDRLDSQPSRLLRGECPLAKKALEELTVSDVLLATPFGAINCTQTVGAISLANKPTIAIVTDKAEWVQKLIGLLDSYNVDFVLNDSDVTSKHLVSIHIQDSGCTIHFGDRIVRPLSLNVDEIRRALREVTHA